LDFFKIELIFNFSKYTFSSPSKQLEFKVNFEREGIYIGGRYCKFSRALPQSPWTSDFEAPVKEGNSVSEKITNVMIKHLKATGSKFVSSGREDIDVRMLGNGRPFAVQVIDAKLAECLRGSKQAETLKILQDEINKDKDIYVDSFACVTGQQAEKLNVGDEGKNNF
jgi:tRNA pseudouridine synthase 10